MPAVTQAQQTKELFPELEGKSREEVQAYNATVDAQQPVPYKGYPAWEKEVDAILKYPWLSRVYRQIRRQLLLFGPMRLQATVYDYLGFGPAELAKRMLATPPRAGQALYAKLHHDGRLEILHKEPGRRPGARLEDLAARKIKRRMNTIDRRVVALAKEREELCLKLSQLQSGT